MTLNADPKARLTAALALAAIVARCLIVLLMPIDPTANRGGDEVYFYQIASNIVEHGEFREGSLRAYRPPGYPAFVAAHLLIGRRALLAVQLTQNLLFIAAALLLRRLATSAFGLDVGNLSFVILMLDPAWLVLPQQMLSETVFVFLLGAAFVVWLNLRSSPTHMSAVALGCLVGLMALTREIGLVIGMLVIGSASIEMYCRTRHRIRAATIAIIAVTATAATLAPWTFRNYRVFRAMVPITTNGPINAYIGNHPHATGGFDWKLPEEFADRWNQSGNGPEIELQIARACGAGALKFIESNPFEALSLWPTKAWLLWRAQPPGEWVPNFDTIFRYARAVFWWPVFLFGIVGAIQTRKNFVTRVLLAIAAAGTAVHLLTYSMVRYRAPYEFFWSALAPVGTLWVIGQISALHLTSAGTWKLWQSPAQVLQRPFATKAIRRIPRHL